MIHGNRGGGKTDCLLVDYLSDVGKGFGPAWNGILFRQTFPQLKDVIRKSQVLFPQIFPKAKYNKQEKKWTFPDGETLYFAHIMREDDYLNFHGHEYPWIGWEELTNWPSPSCYVKMKTCSRVPKEFINMGLRKRIRATTNPSGPGNNWVKEHFINRTAAGKIYEDDEGNTRTHLRVDMLDNPHLVSEDDISYLQNMMSIEDPVLRAAWLEGSWNITSGGMFDDIFEARYNIVKPFRIPEGWEIDRCFDWGSTKPHATLWVAESDGTPWTDSYGRDHQTKRGDLFVIRERYGWTGKPNVGDKDLAKNIARAIKQIDNDINKKNGPNVLAGPADAAIYNSENGNCIATDMEKEGVFWKAANKGPNTRPLGWQMMRDALYYARPMIKDPQLIDGEIREIEIHNDNPGLYFFDTCVQCIRTLPSLPRDVKKPEDVDSDTEDHIADALRYRLLARTSRMKKRAITGW